MPTNERFVRWQATLREHLSYAVNLFLTFSVAALGYGFSLVRDKTFIPVGCVRCLFLMSLFLLWASIVLGMLCVLNRLRDFRGTAQRVRGVVDKSIPEKEYLDRLGEITWNLFYCQCMAFGLGVTALGFAVLLGDGMRLFLN